MSTVTAATTHPSIDVAARKGLVWLPDWAMIRAERQKLSKRRGLMAAAVILSVGSMIVTFGILIALHASNAVKYGPAGGISHLSSVSTGLFQVAAVVAILVGATAGAGDLAVGFFRNLAVTGRSRLSLFLARIPGGLMVLLPIMAVAFAVVAVGSVAFAGSLAAPSTALLITDGLWILLVAAVMFLLALGAASVIGSRSTSISVLLAFQLVLTPILAGLTGLTWLRQLWIGTALQRLRPVALVQAGGNRGLLAIAGGAAIAVVIVWSLVSVVAGARRTVTQDA
jgi:hypothetical protein